MKNKFKNIFIGALSLLSITSLFSCSKQESTNIESNKIKTSVTNDVSTLSVDSNLDISNKIFSNAGVYNATKHYVVTTEEDYGPNNETWYYHSYSNLPAGWYILDAPNFLNLHQDSDSVWEDITCYPGTLLYTNLNSNKEHLNWDYFENDNCWDYPYIIYATSNWSFSYYTSKNYYKSQILMLREADAQSPSINGTNNFIVNVDNMLSIEEIISHISAIDETDGPVEVKVESATYDPSNRKIGVFNIIVYAADSAGNKTSATITVNVVDTTAPIASASNKTQPNNNKLSDEEILALVEATDNYYSSKDLSKSIILNEYSANYTRPGRYQVKVRVTDPSTRYTDVVFYITVNDVVKPTITGVNKTQPNNVKLSEAELLALFTASDDVSTNLRKELIENDYILNYTRPGRYNVTCRVYDEANNYSDATITITVEDKGAPTITGTNKNQSYTTKLTQEELLALFTVSDDVSTNLRKEIITDDYTENYSKKGIYTVTCRVYDEANNYKDASITITVEDKIPPIVTGSDITLGNNQLTSLDVLKSKITCTDGYDGPIEFSLTDLDGYISNYNIVGEYRFLIEASDSSGNSISKTITIHVEDRISPDIWLDNYFIVLEEGQELTDEDIIKYAAMTLGLDRNEIAYIDGEYNLDEAGTYALSVCLIDGTTKDLKLSVLEHVDNDNDVEENSYFEQLLNDYVDNWSNIKNWNWLHYATILAALAILFSITGVIVKKRK